MPGAVQHWRPLCRRYDTRSSSCTGVSALALLVSTMQPLAIISSMMWCVVSRLNMMSSSHTLENLW